MGNKKKVKIEEKQVIKKESEMSAHWDIKEFIPNITVKEIEGFNYYFWNHLPDNAKVVEGNISEGDIVYRAQDLRGKAKISSKFEYTFIKFEKGYALIKQSKYYHEKMVRPEELCKKDESSYVRRKRVEDLELRGEIFFTPDDKTQKKVNRRLKKKNKL